MLLTPKHGDLIWSYQTDANIYSSPAVVNGVAYFGSYDGNIYAVGQSANASNSATPGTSSSGVPSIVYYAIAVVVIVIILAVVGVALFRKRHK